MFLLQRKQSTDGFDVPGILLLGATSTKVIVRDAEIPGRLRCIFFKLLRLILRRSFRFRFVLPQSVLKLLFVDDLMFPRIAIVRVDAHIGIPDVADGAFDGLRRQVYHNMVVDIIVRENLLHSDGSVELLLFIQLTNARQIFLPEGGVAIVEHLCVLQGNRVQDGIDVLYDKLSAIKLDPRTQRQIIFFPQKLRLMVVRVIFVHARQIDAVALGPQFLSFGCPPFRCKAGDIDLSEGVFLRDEPVIQEPGDGMGILTVKQVEAAQLKADQCVPVQCFQRRIFGSSGIVQHGKLPLGLLHGGTQRLFVFSKIAVGLDHQINVLLDLIPAEKRFPVVGVVLKL